MAKPILVTRIPITIIEQYSTSILEIIRKEITILCPDYNILLFVDVLVKTLEFEVFNVQDYEQIDFETLRNKLENINKND